jgi:CheY-like chemotaxis protein
MIKMSMDKIKDTEVQGFLENCNSCAKLLLHFVNSILDSSQIDAQKIQLNPEHVKVSDLTQEIFSLYNFQASFKKLEFNIHCDSSLPTHLYIDKYRLLQILINLISNAIKFTPKGSVSLEISCDKIREKIRFAVRDTGIGIKLNDMKYLFQNFGKLEQADKNINARGVGLGLSISNELVKLLNCNRDEGISVNSKENGGSEFIFFTPLLSKNCQTYIGENCESSFLEVNDLTKYKFETLSSKLRMISDEEFERLNQTMNSPRKKNCLVVDDNSYNLLAATYILKTLKLDFATAQSGNEAIDILSHDEFDIIFMDIQMPVLDGVETSKILLAKMEKNLIKNCPIIALTANGEGNKDSYIKLGMKDMIVKPVTVDKLNLMIKKYT